MRKRVTTIILGILGIVVLAAVLLATVPQLRSTFPGIARFVPGVGPAGGLTFRVNGPSMEPEFKTGQTLTFVPLSSDRPQRCDVVLYHPVGSPSQVTFKRVVAVGGDTVSFGVSSVLVNGKEPCPAVLHGNQGDGSTTTHLGPSQYFVVGDNLPDSQDSRAYGPIDRSSILGYLPG